VKGRKRWGEADEDEKLREKERWTAEERERERGEALYDDISGAWHRERERERREGW